MSPRAIISGCWWLCVAGTLGAASPPAYPLDVPQFAGATITLYVSPAQGSEPAIDAYTILLPRDSRPDAALTFYSDSLRNQGFLPQQTIYRGPTTIRMFRHGKRGLSAAIAARGGPQPQLQLTVSTKPPHGATPGGRKF